MSYYTEAMTTATYAKSAKDLLNDVIITEVLYSESAKERGDQTESEYLKSYRDSFETKEDGDKIVWPGDVRRPCDADFETEQEDRFRSYSQAYETATEL